MTVVALILAALAAVLAYVGWSRAQAVAKDLAQVQAETQQLRADQSTTRKELQGRIDDLCREARLQGGGLRFTPNMTIAEALQVHPGVAKVLAEFQLTGCSNCEVSDVDTLEGACRSYGIDQDALLRALNSLLSSPAVRNTDKPIKIGSGRVDI